jgi:hypothetical protein
VTHRLPQRWSLVATAFFFFSAASEERSLARAADSPQSAHESAVLDRINANWKAQRAAVSTSTLAQASTETAKAMKTPRQIDLSGDEHEVISRLKSLSVDEADLLTAHHLRAIGMALHGYVAAHNLELPPSAVPNAKLSPEKRLSGLVLLLPYFETRPSYYKKDDDPNWLKTRLDPKQAASAATLYKSIDLTKAWDDPVNLKAARTIVPVFLVPGPGPYYDKHGFAVTNFAFVRGYGNEENGAFPEKGNVYVLDPTGKKDVIGDGTSTTLGIGQVTEALGPWIAAGSSTSRFLDGPNSPFGSRYGRAAYFANCDGFVFFLDLDATDSSILKAMVTRGGGEIVNNADIKRYRSAKEWKKATQPAEK